MRNWKVLFIYKSDNLNVDLSACHTHSHITDFCFIFSIGITKMWSEAKNKLLPRIMSLFTDYHRPSTNDGSVRGWRKEYLNSTNNQHKTDSNNFHHFLSLFFFFFFPFDSVKRDIWLKNGKLMILNVGACACVNILPPRNNELGVSMFSKRMKKKKWLFISRTKTDAMKCA